MPFSPLHEYLPEIAERETRSIMLFPGNEFNLPPADYGLVEMFCNEPGCDCRRVMFSVLSSRTEKILAVVSYGWESRQFYKKWFRYGNPLTVDELTIEMQGPILSPMCPQTEHAPAILALVKKIALTDVAYVDRVKRHYALFREKIDVKMNRLQRRQAGKRRR